MFGACGVWGADSAVTENEVCRASGKMGKSSCELVRRRINATPITRFLFTVHLAADTHI